MKNIIQSIICVFILLSISSFNYCYAISEKLEDAEILVFSECYEEALIALNLIRVDLLDLNDKHYHSFLKGEAFIFLDDMNNAFFNYKSIYDAEENDFTNKAKSRIAYIFFLGGDYEKTIDVLLEIPNTLYKYRDYIVLIRAYKYKKYYKKALQTVNKLLAEDEDLYLLQEKASVYIYSEEFDKAVDLFTYLLDFDKDDLSYNLYNNLIYSLNKAEISGSKVYIDFMDFAISSNQYNLISNKSLGIFYQNKAEYYSRIGCHSEAISLIDQAILVYFDVDNLEEIDLKTNRDKQSLLDFYDEKIRIYKAANHPNTKDCFLFVDKVINWLKLEAIEEDIHFRKSTDYDKYYLEAFYYYLDIGAIKEAYESIAKTKDSALRQSILLNSMAESKFKDNVNNLNSVNLKKGMSLREKNSLRIEALGNYIIEAKSDSLFDVLDLDFSLEEFQNKIPLKSVIIDYYIYDSVVHIFSLSTYEIQYYSSKINLEIVKGLKQEFSERPQMSNWSSDKSDLLNKRITELSKIVLPNRIAEFDKIVFIPQDALNGLVFEPLQLNNKMLVESHDISYSSSIFLLDMVLDSTYDTKENFVIGQLDKNKLQGSKVERDELLTKYNFNTISSKSDLLAQNKEYNILHFSNHGKFEKNRYESYININESERLTLGDLLSKNLKSNLVFLAGCETRKGEIIESEGMYGLSRVYFQSGVKSVVSSMHKINDATSSEIVTRTYDKLYQGENIVRSLRAAKLEYLSEQSIYYSHPYFWAGLVLEGNTEIKVVENRMQIASILF